MSHRPDYPKFALTAGPRKTGLPLLVAAACIAAMLAGCAPMQLRGSAGGPMTAQAAPLGGDLLAPGVMHRSLPTSDSGGMDVVDVDLARAAVHLGVGAEGIRLADGVVVGDALSPSAWVQRTAIVAVNGGYFGQDHGDDKEIVGLLTQAGRVRHASGVLRGSGTNGLAAGCFVRSALGILRNGTPEIVWAASDPNHPQILRAYATPVPKSARAGRPWQPRSAIGCGPTLIAMGQAVTTDRKERLASEGSLPRTFVAYDRGSSRKACHFIVGISSGATFQALAGYIQGYFSKYDGTRAWAAMCLDGGASSQMSYRIGSNAYSPRDTGVTVPDCLLVLPGR